MLTVRNILLGLLLVFIVFLMACDLASDTADEAEQAGEGAVGVAEQMHEGTLSGADEEDY